MTVILIASIVSLLAGGFGGYKYGRIVEVKAQAELAAFKQGANQAFGGIAQAGQDLKKGL